MNLTKTLATIAFAILAALTAFGLGVEIHAAAQPEVPVVSIRQVETNFGENGTVESTVNTIIYLAPDGQVTETRYGPLEHRYIEIPFSDSPIFVHAVPALGIKTSQVISRRTKRGLRLAQADKCRANSSESRRIFDYMAYAFRSETTDKQSGEKLVHTLWNVPELGCRAIEQERIRILPDGRQHAMKTVTVTEIRSGVPDGIFEIDPLWVETPTGDAVAATERATVGAEAYQEWIASPEIQAGIQRRNESYLQNKP